MLKTKEKYHPEKILNAVHYNKGTMWEKIATFQNQISQIDGAANHELGKEQEKIMKEYYPLKHHFEGGLYTREIFMPEGSLNVSFIHKQEHPSFLLEGKVSFLDDNGEIKTIEAPYTVFTKIGTQRIFYIHKDTRWACVYKTDATTPEDAEKEIYATTYKSLPKKIIKEAFRLCQD